MGSPMEYRRLRAPSRHGEILTDPPLTEVGPLIQYNESLRAQYAYDFQGHSLSDCAATARNELLDLATQYTRSYRDIGDSLVKQQRIFLAGHQPELYHAGVWFKSFVLSQLAKKHQAVGINLIIDNDRVQNPAINVPVGSLEKPRVTRIAMDREQQACPFEERECQDLALFNSFATRVATAVSPFESDPLILRLWPHAMTALSETPKLGQSIARARHQFEAECGLETCEVPLSLLCSTWSFYHFASHLLAHLPRFHQAYNEALGEYRRVHRLRNIAQPLPDLASESEWLEAPFWLWSAGDPTRRRVYVKSQAGHLRLKTGAGDPFILPISADSSVNDAAQCLLKGPWKLRPRALVTTMYARLMLSDLFLHGIGGAKYDRIAERIVRNFFGFELPQHLTVSATMQLPLQLPEARLEQLQNLNQQLRDLQFHPERHVLESDRSQARPWIESKQKWIHQESSDGSQLERHRAIERANSALQCFVAEERRRLETRHLKLADQLPKNQLLSSREFPFCLYAKDFLVPLLLDLAEDSRCSHQ